MSDAKNAPTGTQLKIYVNVFEIGPTTVPLGVFKVEIAADKDLVDLRQAIFAQLPPQLVSGSYAAALILKPNADGAPMKNDASELRLQPFHRENEALWVHVEVPKTHVGAIPSPVRPRFLALLKKRSNTSHDVIVSDATWRNIVRLFASRVFLALDDQNVDFAYHILADAKAILSNVTVGALEHSGFAVLSDPVSAYNSNSSDFYKGYETKSGRPVILKCPRGKFRREIEVCEDLKLEENEIPGLVCVAVHRIPIRENKPFEEEKEGGEEDQRQEMTALVMPDFAGTLRTAFKLDPECIVARSEALIQGLNWLHARGYVHMDVKSGNIFVGNGGGFYLGDFGSCVRVNEPIYSTTTWYHPGFLSSSSSSGVALFEYDWFMLAVTLFLATQDHDGKVEGPNLHAWETGERGEAHVDVTKIKKEGIEQIQHKALRELLTGLLACKTAAFFN